MTWIVGTPTMFGYGFAISDIRVTLADGSERDCLQKIHPVGQFLAAGFAGSVRIGFAMVETLSTLLHTEDKSGAWEPEAVAAWWPEDARQVFGQFDKAEQALHSHLMMISTHPTEHTGNPDWPRAYVHVFKSPTFDAVSIPVHKVTAIGCGTEVQDCREAIDTLSSSHERMFSIMQAEVGNSGGMGTMLGFSLTRILKETRPKGISSHLHYCWVYRGRIVIDTNDHESFGPWTSMKSGSGMNQQQAGRKQAQTLSEGATVFRMPELASTWQALEKLLKANGARAEGCSALPSPSRSSVLPTSVR